MTSRMPSLGLTVLALACALAAPSASAAERLRVASLVPFVIDVAELIPEQMELVGTVRESVHIPVPEGTTDLGNPHEPSDERIAALSPDVIVIDKMMHQRMLGRLRASGAEIVMIDTTSVDSTLEGLVALGRRAGAEDAVRAAADEARTSLAANRLEEPMEALIVFATPGSPMLVTKETWVGDLLAQVGFQNTADPLLATAPRGRFPGFLQVSDELLATSRPDVILLLAHGDPRAVEGAFRDRLETGAWRAVGESAQGRVVVLPPSHFSSNPGLGVDDAALAAVGALNPVASGPPSGPEPGASPHGSSH